MRICKLHSLGNDFLVLPPGEEVEEAKLFTFALSVCDRHTGAGADGLLVLSFDDRDRKRIRFRIFNPDGSEAEISGNGLRCAAACLFHQDLVSAPTVQFLTPSGERTCRLVGRRDHAFEIRIELGEPRFSSDDIPFEDGRTHETIVDYPLSIQKRIYPITCVSMGNPHCDLFFDRFPSRIEWHQIGQAIETHPFFPKRTNVEFIKVVNRQEIEVLFWERSVGETLSSGSGSSAAAVAAMLKGLTDHKVRVRTSLGEAIVEWVDGKILQTGPAEIIFVGEYFPRPA